MPIDQALQVCGLPTAGQHNALVAFQHEGLQNCSDFAFLTDKDVRDMCDNMSSRSFANNGYKIGALQVKKVRALAHWARDLRNRQQPILDNAFTQALMEQHMVAIDVDPKEDQEVKKPATLDPEEWDDWEPSFVNYLMSLYGRRGTPLAYVIRDPHLTPNDFPDTDQLNRLIYSVSVDPTDHTFVLDSARVAQELISFISTTEAASFVNLESLDGRTMMQALRQHYDGPGEIRKRYNKAKTIFDSLHYKNEAIFPFSKFQSKFQWCMKVYDKAHLPMHVTNQMTEFMAKIKVKELDAVKETARSRFPESITDAGNYVSERISEIFAEAIRNRQRMSRGNPRRISAAFHGGRGRGRGRDGRGARGGPGRGHGRGNGRSQHMFHGVDISDPTRQFTPAEFDRMGPDGRRLIYDLRRNANSRGSGPGGRGRSHGRGFGTPRGSSDLASRISALESAIGDSASQVSDLTNNHDAPSQHTGTTGAGSQFGRGRHMGRTGRGRTVGKVTILAQTSRQGSAMRINKTNYEAVPHLSIAGSFGRNEIDSLAETSCAGANWIPLFFTGETVDVSDYHGALQHRAIPIATCATKLASHSGATWILIMPQMLYFGQQMARSLINPNQVRMSGTLVRDDPTLEGAEAFGLITEKLFVPFQTTGATIFFSTYAPTFEEVEECMTQTIGPNHWDPHTVNLRTAAAPNDKHAIELSATNVVDSPIVFGKLDSTDHQATELEEDENEPQVVLASVSTALEERTFDRMMVSRLVTTKRHSEITPEEVSKKFGVGLETAKDTLKVTTQRGIRHAVHPIHRRYRTDHLDLHRKRLGGVWQMDTLVARHQSLQGNKYAHVITNGKYTRAFPVKDKTSQLAADSLSDFIDDVGVPQTLWTDGATEFTGHRTPFRKLATRERITLHTTESGQKNQNHDAEREIGMLKRKWKDRMNKKQLSPRLWDYGIVTESELLTRTARGPNRRTGYEEVTGNTPDISEWCDFETGDLVWFRPHGKLTEGDKPAELALWLGVAHRVGSDMCYWVLPKSGNVQSHTTVQHVTQQDYANPEHRQSIADFQQAMKDRLNDEAFELQPEHGTSKMFLDDVPVDSAYPLGDKMPDYEDNFPPPLEEEEDAGVDHYLKAELVMDTPDGQKFGRVLERAKHPDGRKIGSPHRNPLFDTREYIIEFPDQSRERHTANTIAENLYSQCDSDGHQFRILEEIVDYRKTPEALSPDDSYRIARNGNKVPKKVTKGHELCVKYKGGETEWMPLKTVKDSNPIEAAEFAKAMGLSSEPAFVWWVDNVLKHKERIISKVKSRYWKTTHMYGIRLPHSVEEALKLDAETNTDYWTKAIAKENKKVKISWHSLKDVTPDDVRAGKVDALKGYQEIKCHMVFAIKMDFTRKARFVARGDLATAPPAVTYSSVVSRDSVRLAFLIAGLNGLDIMACDVTNAYLNAPAREKVWFVGGKDTGEDEGLVCVVDRAIYGLKSSGASWRNMLVKTILDFDFEPTRADPDVYRRPAEKDGFKFYEYILVYVDDILILSKDPKHWLEKLQAIYEIKEESIGPPKTYLGAQTGKTQLPNGSEAWYMAADQYCRNAVDVLQRLFEEDGHGLKLGKAKQPVPSNYKPELDVTEELDPAGLSRYRQLVGILRWAVELGRIDIFYEVAVLSQYLASPRKGHLEAVYHIFAYLNNCPNVKAVFDHTEPYVNEDQFEQNVNWKEIYGEVVEEYPPIMPEPRGNYVIISCFVDADHAGNKVTRRSHTGIIIFVNNAPILFYSKRQNTVESSTFGSELVAMRAARDMIVGLRYKLRMFGVPVHGPANVYCDNQGVVKNTSLPESTLSKKHNSINYHVVREAAAAGILRVGKEPTDTNLADVLTKILPRIRREKLLANILYGPWSHDDWLTGRKRKAHPDD